LDCLKEELKDNIAENKDWEKVYCPNIRSQYWICKNPYYSGIDEE
jgi:hypothetical protein